MFWLKDRSEFTACWHKVSFLLHCITLAHSSHS